VAAERVPDTEAILTRLNAVLAPGPIEEFGPVALAWLTELTHARTGLMVLLDREDIAAEFVHPGDGGESADAITALRRLASDSARRGAPLSAPGAAGSAPGTQSRAWPLGERGRAIGAVALALPRADDERAADRLVAEILAILARRISCDRELARVTSSSEQYGHWFKMLDKQIRVLERERQKFSAVVNQSDLMVFVTDLQGTIRWANRTLARRLPPAEGEANWVGRTLCELTARLRVVPAAELPRDAVMRAIENGEAVHLELVAEVAEGARNLYLTALPIKGADGAAHEVMMLMQDVTNLEVVRHAEERLSAVVKNSPIVLFALDKDGMFTLSEGRGLEALELRPGEVVGRSAIEMYAEMPEVLDALRRGLAGEEFTQVVPVGALAFETRFRPLRAADGSLDGLIGVATDITERVRSEENLRRAQKLEAVGRLAAGVAHDFNNLLTAVMGHAHLLGTRIRPDDPLQDSVREIYGAGARGGELTRQLMAFSRRGAPTAEVVDLNAVVVELEEPLRRILGDEVDLLTSTSERPARVRAERPQVEQVLVNLTANARDAMPAGGRLRLTVEVDDLGVGLSVEDSGVGMDDGTRRRLFEPFFTTKDKAAGLGLSVVYGLVRQWEAEIEVDSAPQQGTRILLRFAAVEASDAPVPLPEAHVVEDGPGLLAPVGSHGGETILLVEDETGVRGPIRETLLSHGYTVIEAHDGLHALDLVEGHDGPIDLVVTDVLMPNMGGGELVRRLRTERASLRVLYMSGYNEDAVVRAGVRVSGDSFLQKPFGLAVLIRRVRELLDSPAPRAVAGPSAA
jgi:signal transduction histidine kinase